MIFKTQNKVDTYPICGISQIVNFCVLYIMYLYIMYLVSEDGQ